LNNSRFHGILAVNTKEFTENKEDLLNIGEEGGLVHSIGRYPYHYMAVRIQFTLIYFF
jgi:hypothetical protein